MELMVQLTVLTGIQFFSPTGIIGNYNYGIKFTVFLIFRIWYGVNGTADSTDRDTVLKSYRNHWKLQSWCKISLLSDFQSLVCS